MGLLSIGKAAPNFALPDQDGNRVQLKDFKGQSVVLYFYPKDLTPGCTQEACDFNDHLSKFRKQGAAILGISRDSVKSHKKFAEKHGLAFPLLADEEGQVTEAYGVWQEKSMYGRKYMGIVRTTILIDAKGKVAQIWENVKVKGHANELLKAVTEL